MPFFNYEKKIDNLIFSSIHIVTGLVNHYIDDHYKDVMKKTGGVVHIRPTPLYNAYYKKTFMISVGTEDDIDEFARSVAGLLTGKISQEEIIQKNKFEKRTVKISLFLGIPATITCLYRVIDNIVNLRDVDSTDETFIAQLGNIFDSWDNDAYPSLMEDTNFPSVDYKVNLEGAYNSIYQKAKHLLSGQCFVLAHEYGHALLKLNSKLCRTKYLRRANNAFNKWIAEPNQLESDILKQHYKSTYKSNSDRWIEELAADIIAYEICHKILEGITRDALFATEGASINLFLQLLQETYLGLKNQEIPPSHPFSSSRLLALNHYINETTNSKSQNNMLLRSFLIAKKFIDAYTTRSI